MESLHSHVRGVGYRKGKITPRAILKSAVHRRVESLHSHVREVGHRRGKITPRAILKSAVHRLREAQPDGFGFFHYADVCR